MKVRITQTDIAQVAGVHNTTVSLSLRNSRLIPDATRKKIQAIAESLGYCRDPALTALVAYRNSRRTKRQADTLAYVTNWETKWGWRDLPSHEQYYSGAQKAAAESGYNLEHFWLGEEGMSQRRLSDMFLNRGISGVLLASCRPTCDDLSGIDWSRLSAVKIGCFPHNPAINQVAVEPSDVINLAIRQISMLGYQRIGLVMPRSSDSFVNQAWSRAFFAEQFGFPADARLPILYLNDTQPDRSRAGGRLANLDDRQAFSKWYDEYRPEVVLGLSPGAPALIRQIGLSVPQNVAYVDLHLDFSSGNAGVRHHCARVGELAVEMLAGQLRQNIFGVPQTPTVTSVCGIWFDGDSMPAVTSSATAELESLHPMLSKTVVAV